MYIFHKIGLRVIPLNYSFSPFFIIMDGCHGSHDTRTHTRQAMMKAMDD